MLLFTKSTAELSGRATMINRQAADVMAEDSEHRDPDVTSARLASRPLPRARHRGGLSYQYGPQIDDKREHNQNAITYLLCLQRSHLSTISSSRHPTVQRLTLIKRYL